MSLRNYNGTKMKFSKRYFLIPIIFIVFILLFYLVYNDIKEKTINEFNNEQLILAQAASQGITAFFQNYQYELTFLSQHKCIIDFNDDTKALMASFYNNHKNLIEAITRVDAGGKIIFTYPYNSSAIGQDISYQKHIRQVLTTHQMVISDVFMSVQGYLAVAMHVPVFKGKEFKGSIAILIQIDRLGKQYLEKIKLKGTGNAWLLSENGIEIFCLINGHTGKSFLDITHSDSSAVELTKKIKEKNKGTAKSIHAEEDFNGQTKFTEKYMVYYRVPLETTYWTIIISYNEEEIYAALSSFRNRLVVIFSFLFIVMAYYFYSLTRVRTVLNEVAKRQETEKSLQESEERFKKLFYEHSAVKLLIDYETGNIADANKAASKFYGWTIEELKTMKIFQINTLPPDEIKKEMQSGKNKEKVYFEFKHRRADGSIRDVGVYSGLISVGGKNYLHSIIHDITSRKQAEVELAESFKREKFWADIVRNASVGVAIGYPDGRLGVCNKAYQKLTGYSEDELKNIDWNTVLTPPEWEGSENIKLQELHKTKKDVQYEKEYIKKDGSRVPVELLVHPQFDKDGNVDSYLAFVLDITERKIAENKFRELSSRNEAILHSVPDIIMEVDNNKIYTWSNKAGYIFFGEDVIGKEAKDYFEGEQETYETVTPILKGARENIYVESWQRRQDGKRRLLAWWCSVLKDKNGNVTGILSTARDITEEKAAQEALRDSQAMYHDLVETSKDLIWQCDAEGKYIYLNPAWEEVFGYKTEEMLGKKFIDFQTKEYAERDLKEFARLLKGNTVKGLETIHIGKEGNEINLAFNAKFVLDNNGDIIGTRGTAYDITERKQTEKTLLENEQNSRDLVENLMDGIAIVDENEKHIYVNPKFCEITGYSKEELLNLTEWDFTRPQDRPMLEQRIKDRIAGKPVKQQYDRIIIKKDGTEVPVEISTSVTIWQGKTRPLAIIHDLTQHKIVEKMLKEREARLQSIFSSAPIGIGVVSNRILMKVNARMTEIIGYSEDELIGQSSRMIYPSDEEFERVGKYKYDQIRKYGTGSIETHFLCKDGKLIDVILSSTPIDPDNLSAGVTFTVLDITERKQVEESLIASEAKNRAMINAIPDLIFILNREGVFVDYHAPSETSLFVSADSFLGKNIKEIMPVSIVESYVVASEQATQTGQSHLFEYSLELPDGQHHYESHLVKYHHNFLSIVRDITERKQAEEKLRQQMNELSEFNKLMVGRENKMADLKIEINKLIERLGETKKYKEN